MSLSSSTTGGRQGARHGRHFRRQTEQKVDQDLQAGSLEDSYGQVEDLLMSYDELVKTGRVEAGSDYFGLKGNQSRLSRGISDFESSLASSDPAFAAYQKTVTEGLNLDENGLPADYARMLTGEVRGAQAARGLIDSSTSGLEEAVVLAGGRERIRGERLSQVRDYLGGVTQGAIQSLFPGIDTVYQGELQRALGHAQADVGAGDIGARVYGGTNWGGSGSYGGGGGGG